ELVAQISESETQQSQLLAQMESEQEQLDRRAYELDTELRQIQNLIGQAALDLDRAENRILFNRRRREELTEREHQLSAERDQSNAQMVQLESRVTAQQQIVGSLRSELDQLESVLSVLSTRSSDLAGTGISAETRIAEFRRQINEIDQSLEQLQTSQG